MPRKVITFDNFKAGEYGSLGGRHAPAGSFTGSNVLVYRDGSVGPRSGLLDLAPTGVPTGSVIGFGCNNALFPVAWFVVGTHVYDFDSASVGAAVDTYTGALASTPTVQVNKGAELGPTSYITCWADKSYSLNTNTKAIAALTDSPGGFTIAYYGDRVVVGAKSGNVNRLFYSAAADPTSWPVANYIDVGGGTIGFVGVTHNRLAITETDGTWSMLSGTPGYNDVLRQSTRGMFPFLCSRASIAVDGTIWFMCPEFEFPCYYAGATVKNLEHLTPFIGDDPANSFSFPSTGIPKLGVTGMMDGSDVCFIAGNTTAGYENQGLLNRGDIWTKHTFDIDVSGWIDGRFDPYRRVIICDGGGAAAKAKFYAWRTDLNRPPFAGTPAGVDGLYWEQLGDDSATVPVAAEFTPADWWSKPEDDVKAAAVVVDFTKWDHGFAVDNAFSVTLTPLYRTGGDVTIAGGAGTAVDVGSFSEDPGEASTTGTPDRRQWTLNSQFANGFTVTVSGLVGVAIKAISVIYDMRPTQGV